MIPQCDELLQMLDLSTISITTVWRWIRYLGFNYSKNKKCDYTDGCEREDVVKDRDDRFLINYFKAEMFVYRWVQITDTTAQNLEDNVEEFPKKCYYEYNHPSTQEKMREYHIDTHKVLQENIPPDFQKYGGSLSVQIHDL